MTFTVYISVHQSLAIIIREYNRIGIRSYFKIFFGHFCLLQKYFPGSYKIQIIVKTFVIVKKS